MESSQSRVGTAARLEIPDYYSPVPINLLRRRFRSSAELKVASGLRSKSVACFRQSPGLDGVRKATWLTIRPASIVDTFSVLCPLHHLGYNR